jgi:hypothetical protein
LDEYAQKEGNSRSKTEQVLNSIDKKIKNNQLLREVYERKQGDYNDLIEKFGGEKVLMAVELVESYRLLIEINKSCGL